MQEVPMPKKGSRRASGTPVSSFLRRPIVQFGILLAAAIVVALIALLGQPSSGSLPAEVTVDKAYEMYQQGAFVLDVREQSEWDEYHAPNTTLIPLGELETRLTEVPKDKPVVVVCRSGNRSQQGRDILKQAGFTNVTSMTGGLKTWRDKGYPIAP
jgi:rhodanese-related sulfurtransferase